MTDGAVTRVTPLAHMPDSDRHRPRVLVVDDARRIRLALRCCLEADGYEVEEAGDGREALAAVERFRPDVVLLDLAMPVLDGLSAARGVDSMEGPSHPKVIVLTAYGSTAMAAAAHDCGVSAFVEKPVLPDALHEVVARVLAEGAGPREVSTAAAPAAVPARATVPTK